MNGLRFGTAGVPKSASAGTTASGIERVKELGLEAMDLEFKTGVSLSEAEAATVKQTAAELGVSLSAHAPYFIDFNSRDKAVRRASQQKLVKTARTASLCGARTVIFHPAFYINDSPQKTYKNVKKRLQETLKRLREEYPEVKIWLRPELTGKGSQFGSLEEVVNLSAELEGVAPALNFAHLHSRTGEYNSYPEFLRALGMVEETLGRAALEDLYVLACGIGYGEGRHVRVDKDEEMQHVNLVESDFNYCELLHALRDFGARGLFICESPNREEDARRLKAAYRCLSQGYQCAEIMRDPKLLDWASDSFSPRKEPAAAVSAPEEKTPKTSQFIFEVAAVAPPPAPAPPAEIETEPEPVTASLPQVEEEVVERIPAPARAPAVAGCIRNHQPFPIRTNPAPDSSEVGGNGRNSKSAPGCPLSRRNGG